MCEHDLKMLSPPVVDIDVSLFGGGGYAYPPIYQCKKCLKVFKTGLNEDCLVEILVNELTEEDKKKMLEHIERKIKFPFFWFLMIIGGIGILGIMIILFFL